MRNIKVGDKFYEGHAWWDDDNKIHTCIDEWIVRSIKQSPRNKLDKLLGSKQPTMVYIIRKTEFTWVKSSKKGNTSYCWAKSISTYDRKKFNLDGTLPFGIYTTIRQAWVNELKHIKSSIARMQSILNDPNLDASDKQVWQEELVLSERILKALNIRINKLKTKKE